MVRHLSALIDFVIVVLFTYMSMAVWFFLNLSVQTTAAHWFPLFLPAIGLCVVEAGLGLSLGKLFCRWRVVVDRGSATGMLRGFLRACFKYAFVLLPLAAFIVFPENELGL